MVRASSVALAVSTSCSKARGCVQIHFFMLLNKQGKVRLSKWYSTYNQKQRTKTIKEVTSVVLARAPQVGHHVLQGHTLSHLYPVVRYLCLRVNTFETWLDVRLTG